MSHFTITTSFGGLGVNLGRDGRRQLPIAFIEAADGAKPWATLQVEGENVELTGSLILKPSGWTTTGSAEGLRVRGSIATDIRQQVASEIVAELNEKAGANDPRHGENATAHHRQEIVLRYERIAEHQARIAALEAEISWHEDQITTPPAPPVDPIPDREE